MQIPPLFRILLVILGLTSFAPAQTKPVALHDKGAVVMLENGIVSFEITKTNGNIAALRYQNTPIFAEPGYLDWVADGNNHIANGAFAVITDPAKNSGTAAEISITQKYAAGAKFPFDVELHYVLRRGDSGPYVFAVFHHGKDYPAGNIAQSRWVLRLDDATFDFINVDETRRRLMPASNTPAKILGPKESSQFTEGPFKDFITDKYHFFVDVGDHFVHGWIGTQKKIGCWVLYGSNEAQNGGPTKQHNSAHFGRMLFKILTCGHYGATSVNVAAGEEWSKIYGPWMLYLNSGGDKDTLWADAKKKASTERASWPYAWMKHPDYPLAAGRGTVKGTLHLTDPQQPAASPANAWVGLAGAEPDWQQQSDGYQFWVHADKDGHFVLPQVRPGSYTLYAFTDGVMDEFRHDGVTVAAGGAVDLGTLEWKPVRYGTQLWQIGTPDRTAKEFRHGDEYRQWGLWQKYPVEFPNDVNFVIGQSKERTDWNYAQVNVEKDGKWVGTAWNILFDVPQPKPGTAFLRIALASATNAKIAVAVNGQPVETFGTARDNAMIRAGIHGQYAEQDVAFDAKLLKTGRNQITLTQTAGGNNLKSVMYDCVRLELDDSAPFDASKLPSLHKAKTAGVPAAEVAE